MTSSTRNAFSKLLFLGSETWLIEFLGTQKQNLPYPLLSDEGGKLRSAMGVGRHYFIIPGRNTFVIDKTGRVILNYSDLNHKNHVKEALSALKNSNLE